MQFFLTYWIYLPIVLANISSNATNTAEVIPTNTTLNAGGIITNSVEERNATTINNTITDEDGSIGVLREDRCNTPDSILG